MVISTQGNSTEIKKGVLTQEFLSQAIGSRPLEESLSLGFQNAMTSLGEWLDLLFTMFSNPEDLDLKLLRYGYEISGSDTKPADMLEPWEKAQAIKENPLDIHADKPLGQFFTEAFGHKSIDAPALLRPDLLLEIKAHPDLKTRVQDIIKAVESHNTGENIYPLDPYLVTNHLWETKGLNPDNMGDMEGTIARMGTLSAQYGSQAIALLAQKSEHDPANWIADKIGVAPKDLTIGQFMDNMAIYNEEYADNVKPLDSIKEVSNSLKNGIPAFWNDVQRAEAKLYMIEEGFALSPILLAAKQQASQEASKQSAPAKEEPIEKKQTLAERDRKIVTPSDAKASFKAATDNTKPTFNNIVPPALKKAPDSKADPQLTKERETPETPAHTTALLPRLLKDLQNGEPNVVKYFPMIIREVEAHNATLKAGKSVYLDPHIIANQIYVESAKYDPGLTSPAGARGLGQFMPRTGEAYGLKTDADFFNPLKNLRASITYSNKLTIQYGSQEKALIAYNAGGKALRDTATALKTPSTKDITAKDMTAKQWMDHMKSQNEKLGPSSDPSKWRAETYNYVRKISPEYWDDKQKTESQALMQAQGLLPEDKMTAQASAKDFRDNADDLANPTEIAKGPDAPLDPTLQNDNITL